MDTAADPDNAPTPTAEPTSAAASQLALDPHRESLAADLERSFAGILSALHQQPDRPQPLDFLRVTRAAAAQIDAVTRVAVDDARAAGHTWHEIGELLSVSRQAAQQRFGSSTSTLPPEQLAALGRRAQQLLGQIRDHDYEQARADWSKTMLAALSQQKLSDAWTSLLETAGLLNSFGHPQVTARGPFRIAQIPLDFAHGPMVATITFDHDDQVVGLFFGLPDE